MTTILLVFYGIAGISLADVIWENYGWSFTRLLLTLFLVVPFWPLLVLIRVLYRVFEAL